MTEHLMLTSYSYHGNRSHGVPVNYLTIIMTIWS